MAVGLGGLKIRINSSPMIAANSYGVNRFISIEFPQRKLGIPHNFFLVSHECKKSLPLNTPPIE